MAKIKTKRHVDIGAVDRKLAQLGLPAGLVMRANDARGEFEIETSDPSVSDGDLQRVLDSVPDAPVHDPAADTERRAKRRADAVTLRDKSKWTPADSETALRLLLDAEIERG